MKIELINFGNFGNDKYGVRRRRWWGGYEYLDLEARAVCYWWSINSKYFRCCIGSRKQSEEAFNDKSRLIGNEMMVLRSRII